MMKNAIKLILSMVLVFTTVSFLYTSVQADDDDEKEYDEHKYKEYDDDRYKEKEHDKHKYKEEHDDYDEREKYNDENQMENPIDQPINRTNVVKESWNKWSRLSTVGVAQEQLPLKQSMNVKIQNGDQTISILAYPYKSEILVPIKSTAELLGADVIIYEKISAIEIAYQQKQLIARLGSRAVYENGLKIPMIVPVLSYDNQLYAPISMLADGLGYTVTYEPQKGFIFTQNE